MRSVFAGVLLLLSVAAVSKADEPQLREHPILSAMLKVNNGLRATVGLPVHQIDERLTRAAQDHANYMARTGVFDHYANGGPSGRAQRFGYAGGVRENIAYGQRDPGAAFAEWRVHVTRGMGLAHWANICSGTRLAGFGCQTSRSGVKYWVGVYGN